jgi:hypothetical protein
MSYGPQDNPIKMTPELEAEIMKSSPDEIKDILHAAMIQQGLVKVDEFNASVLHPVEQPAAQGQSNQSSLTVDGKTFTGTQEQLNEQLRAHFQSQQQQPTNDAPPRDQNGRFAKQNAPQQSAEQQAQAAADRAMLDLQFKRGEIDAATFLEKSGAMQEYLQKQGVDLDALRDVSAGKTFEKKWNAVTDEFLRSPEGQTWPGGEELKNAVGLKIAELGLVDQPSVASIKRAWDAVKEDTERFAKLRDRDTKLASARSREEVDELLERNKRGVVGGGGLWNR